MKKLLILGQVPKEYGGSYTTGVANVIMEIVGHLKGEFDVYIYATNLNSGEGKKINGISLLGYSYPILVIFLIKEFLNSPIRFFRLYGEFKNKFGVIPIKNLSYLVILKHYIKKIKPDIINAHGIMFAPILKNLDIGRDVFYSFHGFMYDDQNSIEANKKRGLDIKKLYFNSVPWVKKAIYLTPEMKSKGENKLKIVADKSSIISNGVNVKKFKYSSEERKKLRNRYNIDENSKIFISVGALTHRKNHAGFIEYLIRNNFKGHYWIIGKFEAEESKNIILNYQESVSSFEIKVINYVDHDMLYQYYSAADIYAHPSTSEGQALVVFEALCCGLPVMANQDIKGTVCVGREYDDSVKFVNLKTSKLLEIDNPNRKKLSQRCKEDFDWTMVADKYKACFLNEFN
ncbi:glycosyltransferase family 4 protein [Hyunsoonleella rubra]|uniref:Glycosyltransferase family 4 protein n=1 Tax=Hyunsoonleella rubra TaxID=1737062 RepID=A0ABW5T683_9FLAO